MQIIDGVEVPETIEEQLRDFCPCVKEDGAFSANVAEMINVVSLATGWMRTPCETLMSGERKEVFPVECEDCPIEFTPYYHPFEPDSFSFYLIQTKGLEETVTELDFSYSEANGLFRVDLGMDCKCMAKECGCPTTYQVMAKYTAGYDLLPDCLLPVFCNLLEVIRAKNSCDCGCGCGGSENSEQNIEYASGDIVTVALETDLGKILVEQYKNQLAALSLINGEQRLWGFVV